MDTNKPLPQVIPGSSPHVSVSGSPAMSSSYENQWLAPGSSPVPRSNASSKEDTKSTASATSNNNNSNNNNTSTAKENAPARPPRKSQKEMTKAERRALQEQQRQEKQSRMAASGGQAQKQGKKDDAKKSQPSQQQQQQQQHQQKPADEQKKKIKAANKVDQNQVPWLMHLDTFKRPNTTGNNKDLHPAVLTLGLLFSEYKIVGSNARCVAMLEAFSRVIAEHRPPSDATFARHIQKHLDPHIAYLLSTRPMSLSMRECIRWLKKEISDIVEEEPPLTDDEARNRLMQHIEHFIRERITMADQLIIQNGLQKIQDGEVILTYGKSSVVENLLLETKKKGIDFKVIVVDSRPLLEGKHLLRRLVAAGIDCSYHLLSSIYVALRSVTKVVMGAHALLSNGAVYSRIGTAMVAMAARDKQIPVMICCETYKFVNRTQVDSLVLNEMGNPDDLVQSKPVYNSCHLDHPSPTQSALSTWRDQPNLRLLNLLYDVTPSKYITLVVTEVGLIPCTSAPVIWREYNEEFGKRK